MAYVYSGYAPLSCRIIQHALDIFTHPAASTATSTAAGAAATATAAAKSALSSFPSLSLTSPFSSSPAPPSTLGANPSGQRPAGGPEVRELTAGWGDPRLESLLSSLQTTTAFHVTQTLPKGFSADGPRSGGAKQTTLVCFVGGCTFTEISALRFLSRQLGGMNTFIYLCSLLDHNIIVSTTKLINGSTFIEELTETFDEVGDLPASAK